MSEQEADPLAEGVRRRDAGALAELLERSRPALLAFVARRLGAALRGKVEPQDVLQELAVKALRELPGADLAGRDPFGWLCHLAEQCIVDGHRHFAAGKRAARKEVAASAPVGEASQDLAALLAASMTSPSQGAVRGERQGRVAEAVASFPAAHREALRLRYGEGLPTKEVAARLGKTDAATRVLLTRLIHRLQELLGPSEAA